MKFIAATFTAVVGLSAMVAAMPQNTITAAPVPTAAGFDSAYSSTLACISACGPGNVYCQADCQGLPTPDKGALDATHDCVAACPPGGDAAKNAAFADCQAACVSSLYWVASGTWSSYVVPTAAGFSSAPAQTTDGVNAETTAASNSGASASKGAKTSSATSGAPSASGTPNSGAFVAASPLLGVAGLVLAVFAL